MTEIQLPHLPFSRPTIDDALIEGVVKVLKSGQLTSGANVLAFEGELSSFCGGREVRVLTSATAAIEVALQLAGVGPGDEVITAAQSFFTVLNMIAKVGAKPVFVDCDLVTRNIDLKQVEAAITPRTKAIMPTHYPGALTDLDALYNLARARGLRVIEDAALALGSRWRGENVGAIGDLVTFSFHPNKNITAIEGGALVVNNEAEAHVVEELRFHGIIRLPDDTRDVEVPGGKFNLPDVNACIGRAQLARLPEFLAKRRALVEHYFKHWHASPHCVLPPKPEPPGSDDFSWNMFCVLLPLDRLTITRKEFRDALAARRIATGVSYEALHLSTLGKSFGYAADDFPNAERIARETVTLPLFPTMTLTDVERVCAIVGEVLAAAKK